MTERQYVETLRQAAADYTAVVGREPGSPHQIGDGARLKRWGILRDKMSPHTFVRIADAWLAAETNKETTE